MRSKSIVNIIQLLVTIFSFLILVVSCGEPESTSTDSGSATFSLVWNTVNPDDEMLANARAASIDCEYHDIETIECLVYDSSLMQIAHGGPWNCNIGQGVVNNIPPGSQRKFVVLGKNISGDIVSIGRRGSINISRGDNNIGEFGINGFYPDIKTEDEFVFPQNDINLECTLNANALKYHFYIADDPSFSNILASKESYTPTFFPSGLEVGIPYYWYVVLTDEFGLRSISSDPVEFSLIADITPPEINATTPIQNQYNVSINTDISATFNEQMNLLSFDGSSYHLEILNGETVFGNVIYNGTTAIFSPLSDLSPETQYIATITTDVEDSSGNKLEFDYSWVFTTGSTLDNVPPEIVSTIPENLAVDSAINSTITATFSESINSSTIKSDSFLINNGDVEGNVTYNGTTATFNPIQQLEFDTTYTVRIVKSVEDLSNNTLSQDYIWSFSTGSAPDTTPPHFESTLPENNAAGIAANASVKMTFDEAIDTATINTETFMVNNGSIGGNVTYSGTTATFIPTTPFELNATYTAKVTTSVRDLSGNALASSYTWSFTTTNIKWIQLFGTSSDDETNALAIDLSDNAYMIGWSVGPLEGDTNAGGSDIFVAKYNTTGNKQWQTFFGTPENDTGMRIAVNQNGESYITGSSFGSLEGVLNKGLSDCFIAKLDSDGDLQWLKMIGTYDEDEGFGVGFDSGGAVYVAGETKNYLPVDGGENQGGWDIFLAKYFGNGVRDWIVQLGSTGEEKVRGMAVDPSGNCYITGYTSGNLGGESSLGSWDIFLAKYNQGGAKQWVRILGTTARDLGKEVILDTGGNAYVTGYASGSLPMNLFGDSYAGSQDLFLSKYNPSGELQWTRMLGTSNIDRGNSITLAPGGGVYITGFTEGSIAGTSNLGGEDIFVSKFSSDGHHLWTELYGTSSNDRSNGIGLVEENFMYISGHTKGNLGGMRNSGLNDPYLMKIDLNN